MRAVLQRVTEARVIVDGEIVGQIGRGWLVLLGVGHGDTAAIADALADKVVGLRCFEDAQGKTNLGIKEVDGAVLLVSQFTLYADVSRGRRPGFTNAAAPEVAEVVCTNTVPIPAGLRGGKLTVISLAPALAEAIRRIHEGESVSVLFGPH